MWYSIGEVSSRFEIELPRLRTWCNENLVDADKRTRGRFIHESEFKKIETIKEIFDERKNVTYEDIREALIKQNLYNQLQQETEEEKRIKEMSATLEKSFEKTKLNELLETVADEFQLMRSEINRLSEIVEEQNKDQVKLLEDEKERVNRRDELLLENIKLLREIKKEKDKSIFQRMFNL